MDKKEEKCSKFVPKPEHLLFADRYIVNLGNVWQTCESLADEKVCANTWQSRYYKSWLKKTPGFAEWLQIYCKNTVLRQYGEWYLIAKKYARNGSYRHLELLMQIAKEFAPGALVDQSQHKYTTIVYETTPDNSRRNRLGDPAQDKVTQESNKNLE